MPLRSEHSGLKASVGLYEFEDGSCPAAEFLGALSSKDRQRVDSLFALIGERGSISNKEHFKKLEGTEGIFEFKRFQVRLLCFFAKGSPARLVITHGVIKKSDKHAKADIERALAIRKRFLGE
ncbi:MAG: type II toxin-antitoxin system RelE/ParE family toxin [Proteobacteria bacterium]|nr:type II toxin-antitoxin system RelE/ParE family toxin [Pseudomonadota bacterium]